MHKLDWDSPLSDEIADSWGAWESELPHIKQIKIPRWNHFSPNLSVFELHGFADASKLVYGAVIYLRIVRDNQVFVSLQFAKSKVASLKSYRIPRLELCAALILARLTHHFLRILQDSVIAVHLWSDSEDVLWYLKSHSSKWEVFVANRCAEIQELVLKAQLHHV